MNELADKLIPVVKKTKYFKSKKTVPKSLVRRRHLVTAVSKKAGLIYNFADWLNDWHITRIFSAISSFAIIVGLIAFAFDYKVSLEEREAREEEREARMWQLATAPRIGNSGKKSALEYLHKRGHSLRGIDIPKAYLQKMKLIKADLSMTNLSDTDLSYVDLRGTDLRDANLRGANFYYADFSDAKLSHAKFGGAVFKTISFGRSVDYKEYTNVTQTQHRGKGAIFSYTNLSDAKIIYSNLSNAHFWKSTLNNVDFSYSNLSRAVFHSFSIKNVNFWGANISDAKLNYANLSGSNFINANLSHTSFKNSNLSGVEFVSTNNSAERVKNLTQQQLDKACISNQNKPPIGLEKLNPPLKPPKKICEK